MEKVIPKYSLLCIKYLLLNIIISVQLSLVNMTKKSIFQTTKKIIKANKQKCLLFIILTLLIFK